MTYRTEFSGVFGSRGAWMIRRNDGLIVAIFARGKGQREHAERECANLNLHAVSRRLDTQREGA